ncbi:RNA polymerase sigma factor [uncultured Psychroserpens sp.]|uniref:RNA polymerase sigma factor n=1 Tax=uncultured Psychroserpens sp. TaxID=255436 RepID=UPI0026105901|nr:RNA polymerase sigma factor [uncultured Psychroserpens sp.]
MNFSEEQFNLIYKSHYARVNRLCLGYTHGDIMLSKDLTQDIFIKVWQNLSAFKNQSNVSTWIYRIAVNTCLLELRKKKSIRFLDVQDQPVDSEDDPANKEEKLHQLYKCIARLETSNKSIILLELEGIPQKEIAEIVGLSHEAVRVRIHRIKQELTKCVKK